MAFKQLRKIADKTFSWETFGGFHEGKMYLSPVCKFLNLLMSGTDSWEIVKTSLGYFKISPGASREFGVVRLSRRIGRVSHIREFVKVYKNRELYPPFSPS